MATLSSILAWRIPWTEEPGKLQSLGCKESDTTERLTLSLCSKQANTCGSKVFCALPASAWGEGRTAEETVAHSRGLLKVLRIWTQIPKHG